MKVLLTVTNPNQTEHEELDVAPIELDTIEPTVGVHFNYPEGTDVGTAIAEAVEQAKAIGGNIARVVAYNGNPTVTPIVGVSEIAEMKGCKRQYASQLGKRRDFPEPITTLRGTPAWDTSEVARYFRDEELRKVGRSGA